MSWRLRNAGLSAVVLALAAPVSAQTPPWPGGAGEEIGRLGQPDGLPPDFEPSGVAWHPRLARLLVVGDEGHLASLDPDGGPPQIWEVGGDLEAVALADPSTPFVLLGVEHPDAIVEFDLERGAATGRRWDLSDLMQGEKKKCGLEALAVVDGRVYAGHQCQAAIYVLELSDDGSFVHLDTLMPGDGERDLAAMHWDDRTRTLYTVYDRPNRLVERGSDGRALREHPLPGEDQEGIATIPRCSEGSATVFVAEDGGRVIRFDAFPVECPTWLDTWAARAAVAAALLLAISGAGFVWRRARSAGS
jgi:hypothetical protein